MLTISKKRCADWRLILAVAAYCAALPYLLKFCLYRISPDAIFYIAVAKKYLSAEFSLAVNGYWGPLLSWLLLPLLKLGVQPLLAIRLVVFFSGLCSIIALRLLSGLFLESERIKSLILAVSVPVAWYFAFTFLTPNLLISSILIFYLFFVFHPDYRNKKRYTVFAGLSGALAYFAQGYGFLFFITHFALFNFFCFIKERRQGRPKIVNKFFIGLAVFLLLSGVWISLLSKKYGHFTVCTGARFNHLCFVNPDRAALIEDPMKGLMEPSSANMLNAWEDPSFMRLPEWNAFGSPGNFLYQLKVIFENGLKTLLILLRFSFLSPFIIIGLAVFSIARRRRPEAERCFSLLLAFLSYCGWFLPVLVQERYLILAGLLLLLSGFYLAGVFLENKKLDAVWKTTMLVLLTASFLYLPLSGLKSGFKPAPGVNYVLAERLKAFKLRGNIASNKDWTGSLFLAYQLNLKYLGIPLRNSAGKEMLAELAEHKIDYFFLWADKAADTGYLRGYREITNGELPGLKIFKLK